MSRLQSLTVRTNAALGRLADLQRRAVQVSASTAPSIVRAALKNLAAALSELQAATDQLHTHEEELRASRARAADVERRLAEFVQALPLAAVWTDTQGTILEANDAAAALLNVARPRLPGKPLMLFLSDREAFFQALAALQAPGGHVVELDMLVRPRERKPRVAKVTGRVLEHDTRWCWFLRESGEVDVQTAPDP